MRTLVALDRIHEESKPFARYGDDEDLDKMLREREDEEDPMAKFIKKKKEKNNKGYCLDEVLAKLFSVLTKLTVTTF